MLVRFGAFQKSIILVNSIPDAKYALCLIFIVILLSICPSFDLIIHVTMLFKISCLSFFTCLCYILVFIVSLLSICPSFDLIIHVTVIYVPVIYVTICVCPCYFVLHILAIVVPFYLVDIKSLPFLCQKT